MKTSAIVRFDVSTGTDAARDAAIERYEAQVEALGIGEVEGTIRMGGIDVVLMIEAEVARDEELESRVLPRLRTLLVDSGLDGIGKVERPTLADDDDWDDDEDPDDEEE